MPAALVLSFAQLGDRAFLAVLLRAVVLTLLLFAAAGWGIFAMVARIETTGWPAWLQVLWTGGGGSAAAMVLTLLLLWLSFTAIATGVAALWLDEIIAAVEIEILPGPARARRWAWGGRSAWALAPACGCCCGTRCSCRSTCCCW